MNILLVENDEVIRKGLYLFLMRLGHSIYTCTDEEEAFEILEARSIDIGIFSFIFKGNNCLDLLRRAKRTKPDAAYFITGVGNIWNTNQSYNCGANIIIKDPLNFARLSVCLGFVENVTTVHSGFKIRKEKLQV